jgi:hypothetical protein
MGLLIAKFLATRKTHKTHMQALQYKASCVRSKTHFIVLWQNETIIQRPLFFYISFNNFLYYCLTTCVKIHSEFLNII